MARDRWKGRMSVNSAGISGRPAVCLTGRIIALNAEDMRRPAIPKKNRQRYAVVAVTSVIHLAAQQNHGSIVPGAAMNSIMIFAPAASSVCIYFFPVVPLPIPVIHQANPLVKSGWL